MNLEALQSQISQLPYHEKCELLELVGKLETAKKRETSQDSFLSFVKSVWPAFIEGSHHAVMAEAFQRVAEGKLKRLIINMPPRHTKSEFASFLLPAWFLGKEPNKKVIQTAHTAELAVGFGRKVRNLFNDQGFKDIFPHSKLQSDSKAAGRWNTNKGGEYFAIGVGGAVTGKGADILIIDDPHSEQDAAQGQYHPEVFDRVYEWYTSGPRQRLQPGGAIIVVMTRWSKRDLTGKIIDNSVKRDGSDEWEVIQLPAIMPSGKSLWPEYWNVKELESLRAELPLSKWTAQYQQDPTSEEGALVKRNGGRSGKESILRPASLLFKAGIQLFLKRKGRTTQPAPHGVFSTMKKKMPCILFYWMLLRSVWSFLSLKRKRLKCIRRPILMRL